MGEVHEAYDTEIGRAVALKIIKSQYAQDRSFRMRFERESHAAAKLQEPHVIPIHGYGEIDGSLFIDMRLVHGTDLLTLLEKGPLEPSRAVAIVTQIAAALDAAHADGLIHRDVKPQNIIVTPADFAYLLDFGLAESARRHPPNRDRFSRRLPALYGTRTFRRPGGHIRCRRLCTGVCPV